MGLDGHQSWGTTAAILWGVREQAVFAIARFTPVLFSPPLYLAWGWWKLNKMSEFSYFTAFAKSESSIWSQSFTLHLLFSLWSLQKKCSEEYQKIHMYLHAHTQLSVRKTKKFSLTTCGEGAFSFSFVSLCPWVTVSHICGTAAYRLVCDSPLPGAMGWHNIHCPEKHIAHSLAPQLLPAVVLHILCVLPYDLMPTFDTPERANLRGVWGEIYHWLAWGKVQSNLIRESISWPSNSLSD